MIALTDALCETIYTVGRQVVMEQTTLQNGANDIHIKTGMDVVLATIYIQYFIAMITGTYCGFTIDGTAIAYFSKKIIDDFGYKKLSAFLIANKDPLINISEATAKYMFLCTEGVNQTPKKDTVSEIRKNIQNSAHAETSAYVDQINSKLYTSDELFQIIQCVKAADFFWCMSKAYHIELSYDKQGIFNLNALISFMIEFDYTLCKGITPYYDKQIHQPLLRPIENLLPVNFTIANFSRVCKTLFSKTSESFFKSVPNQTLSSTDFAPCHALFCSVFDEFRAYLIVFVGEATINKYGGQWVNPSTVVDETGREWDILDSVNHRLFKSNLGFLPLCIDFA